MIQAIIRYALLLQIRAWFVKQICLAPCSSLMSPDSETIPNTLVLVAHGTTGDLRRLEEMRISKLLHPPLRPRRTFSPGFRSVRPQSSHTICSSST